MTKERIEDFREVVLPFVRKRLLETNYEGLGESDAEEFAKDFDEILDMAKSALENASDKSNGEAVFTCSECKHIQHFGTGYCLKCGRMKDLVDMP